jgi:hypothetical protein
VLQNREKMSKRSQCLGQAMTFRLLTAAFDVAISTLTHLTGTGTRCGATKRLVRDACPHVRGIGHRSNL